MKPSYLLTAAVSALILSGCANREGVAPSKNTALDFISPTIQEDGTMQRSLDAWLKEEWNPVMASEPTSVTTTQSDGSVITTKTEPITTTIRVQKENGEIVEKTTKGTQIITTTKASNGTLTSKTEVVALDENSNEPFTLQKYADRWKNYLEIKEKINIGQPKEASHIEMMQSLPVVGK